MSVPLRPARSDTDADLLRGARHSDPHSWLGPHAIQDRTGRKGVVIRAMHPDAAGARCVAGGVSFTMRSVTDGVFEARIPDMGMHDAYRLHFAFANGHEWETDDAYRFAPTLSESAIDSLRRGDRPWRLLGARQLEIDGVSGVAFATWAPAAARVSVVGPFCLWDGRRYPMRRIGGEGLFEIFIPGLTPGELYKFEVLTAEGDVLLRSDPFACAVERDGGHASIVHAAEVEFEWSDAAWMRERRQRDPAREPLLIYQVHPGTFDRSAERELNYRELAPRLVEIATRYGCTHVQLTPQAECSTTGGESDVLGLFALRSRHGRANDLRFLVDECHAAGIGVIFEWPVTAELPAVLERFDGSALYEVSDALTGPRRSTFDPERAEVAGYLLASADFWCDEFHADAVHVGAVSQLVRCPRNASSPHSDSENPAAIAFLRELTSRLNSAGIFSIAEETSAWPGVTGMRDEQRTDSGAARELTGLGFTFKWHAGWVRDTLHYFTSDPLQRSGRHDALLFSMLYEYEERFLLPLSLQLANPSLLSRMPGDRWQQFANMRLLLAWQYTRPGKKLVCMGTELPMFDAWSERSPVAWEVAEQADHAEFAEYVAALGSLYRGSPSLWAGDHDAESFHWIDTSDREISVFAFSRRYEGEETLVVLNCTPVPRPAIRIGAVSAGRYDLLLNSDAAVFAGSGAGTHESVQTEPVAHHAQSQSLLLSLPPLGALVLRHTASV